MNNWNDCYSEEGYWTYERLKEIGMSLGEFCKYANVSPGSMGRYLRGQDIRSTTRRTIRNAVCRVLREAKTENALFPTASIQKEPEAVDSRWSYCPWCGQKLEADWMCCPRCGKAVKEERKN